MDVFDVSFPAEVTIGKVFPYHEVILMFSDLSISVVDTEVSSEERYGSVADFCDNVGIDLDEFNEMYKHYYHTKMKERLASFYKKNVIRIYVAHK